jgi:hypothetical protein
MAHALKGILMKEIGKPENEQGLLQSASAHCPNQKKKV